LEYNLPRPSPASNDLVPRYPAPVAIPEPAVFNPDNAALPALFSADAIFSPRSAALPPTYTPPSTVLFNPVPIPLSVALAPDFIPLPIA